MKRALHSHVLARLGKPPAFSRWFLVTSMSALALILGLTTGHLPDTDGIRLDDTEDISDWNPLSHTQSPQYQKRLAVELRNIERTCIKKDAPEERTQCINTLLRDISSANGARFSLDLIEPLAQQEPALLAHSHDLSHTIGIYAIEHNYGDTQAPKEGADGFSAGDLLLINKIGKALVDCDGWGAFGCYHGVIEAGLSRLPPVERTRVISKACLENSLIQSRQYYINQCLHWFGHGMAIFTSQTLKETLAICESMGKQFGSDNVQLCLSGVFHAGSVPGDSDVDFLANVRRVYDAHDVYFPCRDLPERFRGQCFSHVPGRTGTPDMEKVFGNCNNIPETDPAKKRNYAHRCYNSGANILLVNTEFSAEGVLSNCHQFALPEYRGYCYEGAVRYWILRDPLLNNPGPFAICKGAEDGAKGFCYRGLGAANYENYFSQDILVSYCKQIKDPSYYNDCTALNIPDVL